MYGADFTTADVRCLSNAKGKDNLIFAQLKPSSAILATDYIVFDFQTGTAESLPLFDSYLGYNTDFSNLPIGVDIVSGTTSATCYINYGVSTYLSPARIVCTSFGGTITTSTTVKMFLNVLNPATVSYDMWMPQMVYSISSSVVGSYSKTNWSIIHQEFLIKSAAAVTASPSVSPYRSSNSLSEPNLSFTFPLVVAADIGDYLVVQLNFPFPQKSSDDQTKLTCTSGNSYLLGFGNRLVCEFTASVSANTDIVFTNTITGFTLQNPSSPLTTAQMKVTAYLSYHSDFTKQTVQLPAANLG